MDEKFKELFLACVTAVSNRVTGLGSDLVCLKANEALFEYVGELHKDSEMLQWLHFTEPRYAGATMTSGAKCAGLTVTALTKLGCTLIGVTH